MSLLKMVTQGTMIPAISANQYHCIEAPMLANYHSICARDTRA
jgi:hypothetical protein